MSSQHSLSAASEERKARLAALRNLKRKQPDDQSSSAVSTEKPPSDSAESDVTRLHLSGRNYDTATRGPKLGFDNAPNEDQDKPTLEEQAADVEEKLRQQAAEEAQDDKGLDLFKLQPRKPNWDLKRNLESKLEILNVRTDNAIARLVRERISGAEKTALSSAAADLSKLDGDTAGVDGIALVEGLRVREQEEEEAERRERVEDEGLLA